MVNIQIQGVSLNDIHKWKWKTKDERKDIVHSKTYFQQLLSKYCSQKHLKQLEINQEIKSTFFGRSVLVKRKKSRFLSKQWLDLNFT